MDNFEKYALALMVVFGALIIGGLMAVHIAWVHKAALAVYWSRHNRDRCHSPGLRHRAAITGGLPPFHPVQIQTLQCLGYASVWICQEAADRTAE